MTNERHFYRCLNCCYVFAVDGPAKEKVYGFNGTGYKVHTVPYCDCGGGKWAKENRSSVDYMGRVTGNMVLRIEDRCPCDSRCTHATGFHCDCVCNGANHGTHAVVKTVINAQGIPKVAGNNLAERMAELADFEAALKGAQFVIDADPGVIALRNKTWISDRAEWERAYKLNMFHYSVYKLKTMAGRMKAIAKIVNPKVKETA